ncbi:hypothetical protein SDC9_156153 [bioreactor metagenome]|uniref:Uncharacterized protein n=1 Tax=bioreactor metagenome TaxID=1076179 RepID=A0A645F3X5_9ZZZZ
MQRPLRKAGYGGYDRPGHGQRGAGGSGHPGCSRYDGAGGMGKHTAPFGTGASHRGDAFDPASPKRYAAGPSGMGGERAVGGGRQALGLPA